MNNPKQTERIYSKHNQPLAVKPRRASRVFAVYSLQNTGVRISRVQTDIRPGSDE